MRTVFIYETISTAGNTGFALSSKIFRLAVFTILLTQNISAQSKLSGKETPYKIKIFGKENSLPSEGILHSVTDSSIILISELDYSRFRSNIDIEKKIVIPANQIDRIILWKKNRFVKVLMASALVGGTIGAISGYNSGDDDSGYVTFSSNEKAILGGIGGMAIGAIAGCFIGTFKARIFIEGNNEKFMRKKDFLTERSAVNILKR